MLYIPNISVFLSQLSTLKGSKHHWGVRDCGSYVKFIRRHSLSSLCFLALATSYRTLHRLFPGALTITPAFNSAVSRLRGRMDQS